MAPMKTTSLKAMEKECTVAFQNLSGKDLLLTIDGKPQLLPHAQKVTLKVPHTAQAVIIDVGDEKDIHPKQKEPVGGRLALAALAHRN